MHDVARKNISLTRKFILASMMIGIPIATLSGCAQYGPIGASSGHSVKTPSDAAFLDALSKSAHQVAASETRTERLNQALHPLTQSPNEPPAPATGPLSLQMNFHWQGSFEKGVESVAHYIGYTVKEIGTQPPTPILVSISGRKMSAWTAFWQLGIQAGRQAGVVIHPQHRMVDIIWGPKQ